MAELKARISLDSSQFKRTLADVEKSANKAAASLGGVGKTGAFVGKGIAASALALGAVAVGKNVKAFTEVRNASVALGASVAVVVRHFQVLGPAIGKAFTGGGFGQLVKTVSGLGGSLFKTLGASLGYVTSVAKGVAVQVASVLFGIASFSLRVGKIIAGAAIAVSGVLGAGIKSAADYAANLVNLSARTGAPVKDLAILSKAFESVGIDADKVGPAINRMQKAFSGVNEEGKPTKAAFDALGLSAESLRGKTPTDQFNAISVALAKVKDPADRAAIAMDLFGKSGGELNQLFTNPAAIQNAQKVLGGQADLLAANAEKFKRVSEAFKNIGDKIRGFFVGIASGLIDKLTALADFLDSIDLSSIGKKIGNALSSGINIIVNAFKQGKLGELVSLTLKSGFATAGDYLIGVIQVAVGILRDSLSVIFSRDFFDAIILGFNGVALKLTAFLAQAFRDPIAAGAALLSVGFQKAIALFYGLKSLFASIAAFFVAAIVTGVQKIIALLPKSLQPAGFKDKSFTENLKEKQAEFIPTDNEFKPQSFSEAFAEQQKTYQPEFLKGVNDLADQTLKAAGETFGRLGSQIAEILRRNIGDFKPGDVFHSAETRKELEALAKSLNIPIETVKKLGDTISSATGDALESKEKLKKEHPFHAPEVDQFARIGLFARASSHVALDFHRQTARNTGKLVSLFEAHLSKPQTAVAA